MSVRKMFNGRTSGFLWILISLIASTAVTAKSKYYDGEIRPYEFGYRIEGNQHRFEKKDANGLISGEFGFITGDGVYHQSVYATDENGNFKLISLKSSFKIEKSTTTTAPPTSRLPPVTHAPQSLKLLKSCSNCRVFEKEVSDKTSQTVSDVVAVTRKGETIPIVNSIRPNKVQDRSNSKPAPKKLSVSAKSNAGTIGTVSPMNIALGISSAAIQATEQINLKKKENSQFKAPSSAANLYPPSGKEASPQVKENLKERDEHSIAKTLKAIPVSHQTSKPIQSVEVTIPVSRLQTNDHQTSKPVHTAQVAIPVSLQTRSQVSVPISTDHITHNKPVESSKTHLSSKNAINNFIGDILYRFNYTAGYHGHNEEGDSAGNKRGGYFIVGRDNIRRGVIYVANENGFAPVVKYEKVTPEEAPHEDTEKSAGLRGYEFEWFHKEKSKFDSLNDSRR